MGKFTRRGTTAAAIAAVAALAVAPAALAADDVGSEIDGGTDGAQPAGTPHLYRFAGEDRIGTSIDAAQRTEGWGSTVIVANSKEFADALAAAPLADISDAPVILDRPGGVPSPAVRDYGDGLIGEDIDTVILASGTEVFSDSYAEWIEDTYEGVNVERVAGADRYETAVALADAAYDTGEISDADFKIFLADGTNYPDALAAGSAAANNNGVVLLTKGSGSLHKRTWEAVDRAEGLRPDFIAVGGPAATAAAKGWGGNTVDIDTPFVGENRYETAIEVAEFYFEGSEDFVLASGRDFPDAIVGGSYAANVDGPLLLTYDNVLSKTTREYLGGNNTWGNGFTFGGPSAVSTNVTDQLAGDVDWTN